MKKIGLGIGVLLFAIVLQLTSSGMGYVSLAIGVIGLVFTILGTFSKSESGS